MGLDHSRASTSKARTGSELGAGDPAVGREPKREPEQALATLGPGLGEDSVHVLMDRGHPQLEPASDMIDALTREQLANNQALATGELKAARERALELAQHRPTLGAGLVGRGGQGAQAAGLGGGVHRETKMNADVGDRQGRGGHRGVASPR